MRRGADKVNLVVASLQLHTVASQSKTAKLRHGDWSIQQPKFIIDGEGNKDGEQMLSSWQNHTAVSARDGLMFWVDIRQGLIYCNVYDETTVLRYIRLPPIEGVEHRLSCRGSNGDVASSVTKTSRDPEPAPQVFANEEHFTNIASDNSKAASSREETILAALRKIPGLVREDMLKAYSILSHDSSGRRFRSLLGLPMNLRKD
ncbi:hypothetical protein HU200_029122 [Digitaria exilis]|uniref:DUF1618 domain-containing protein n=1 Tax=Digitaria exilis TaxID=1010633 RepID=A0A835BTB5_9POAL|nr:hypothetical protein HU200_029122 [Digitaria exilis]